LAAKARDEILNKKKEKRKKEGKNKERKKESQNEVSKERPHMFVYLKNPTE
jgi:hypothetical protein